ncbi:MAG: hypothetical protein QOF85_165 [Solirubrobacterales bacterium]|jgi:hypothetical protein|nr:hypothetical protein [Solirubrobacterales bacterium]
MAASPSVLRSVGLAAGIPLALFACAVMLALFAGIVVGGAASCGGGAVGSLSSKVPKRLVPIYEQAAAKYRLGEKGPSTLAAINWVETGFGTNLGPSSAGAQGWMQFIPSSWEAFGVDGDEDGDKDPDDPWDAIFSAAHYLRLSGAPGNWHDAIFSYNHAEWYVEKVLRYAERFAGSGGSGASVEVAECSTTISGSPVLRKAVRLFAPRAFKPIPARLWVGEGATQSVDARIWPDAVWLLETYDLRVTAAREAGHQTHGDGTAMDMVPAAGRGWDETALRAALDLGWIPSCGPSGSAPVCPLAPAIQFVGYNGYPDHGDPAHTGSPHLHVSWSSSEYGCPGLCAPRQWVEVFPWAE